MTARLTIGVVLITLGLSALISSVILSSVCRRWSRDATEKSRAWPCKTFRNDLVATRSILVTLGLSTLLTTVGVAIVTLE